jgi:hypothetical protein
MLSHAEMVGRPVIGVGNNMKHPAEAVIALTKVATFAILVA